MRSWGILRGADNTIAKRWGRAQRFILVRQWVPALGQEVRRDALSSSLDRTRGSKKSPVCSIHPFHLVLHRHGACAPSQSETIWTWRRIYRSVRKKLDRGACANCRCPAKSRARSAWGKTHQRREPARRVAETASCSGARGELKSASPQEFRTGRCSASRGRARQRLTCAPAATFTSASVFAPAGRNDCDRRSPERTPAASLLDGDILRKGVCPVPRQRRREPRHGFFDTIQP
jgi:hypothetical protein